MQELKLMGLGFHLVFLKQGDVKYKYVINIGHHNYVVLKSIINGET